MPMSEEIVRELKRAIEVRQLHGSRSPTSLEWWYFTGHLWKKTSGDTCEPAFNRGDSKLRTHPDLAIQATFFLSDADARKGLLAHAAEADLKTKQHKHSEISSILPDANTASPLAFAEKNFLNIALGHWRLSHLGNGEKNLNWDLRFDVKGSEYLLQLDIPKSKFWFHGKDGYLQKTPSSGNFYYSIPFIKTQGLRIERNSSGKIASEPVCGQLWFDHEIHVQQVLDVGWRWFGLSFSNQKALMFYEIQSKTTQYPPQGEIWDHVTGQSAALRNVNITAGASVCLLSKRCYPQSFNLSFTNPFNGKTESVEAQADFSEQELASDTGGLSRVYWEGSTRARWYGTSQGKKSATQVTEGIGFTEQVPQVTN